MGLSESIEKILLNSNGQITLEKINKLLDEKYARQTILDFVKREKNLISFDGEKIILIKYSLQYFIRILENFIGNTGLSRKDIFYLGAFYLYLQRRYPEQRPSEVLNSTNYIDDFEKKYFDISILSGISSRLDNSFEYAMIQFFEQGWIEKLNSQEFFYWSSEFYEYFINLSNTRREFFSTPTTLVQLICRIVPLDRPLKSGISGACTGA